MAGGHRRSRSNSSKGVLAVGNGIGKLAPRSRVKKSSVRKPRPRVTDLPEPVRAKISKVLTSMKNWGPHKNVIAADAIIKATKGHTVQLSLVKQW